MIYLFIFEVQTVLKLFSGLIFVDIYRERLIKVDRLVVFVETCSRVSYKNISTRFNVNRSCYGNRRCLLELLLVKKKKIIFKKFVIFNDSTTPRSTIDYKIHYARFSSQYKTIIDRFKLKYEYGAISRPYLKNRFKNSRIHVAFPLRWKYRYSFRFFRAPLI